MTAKELKQELISWLMSPIEINPQEFEQRLNEYSIQLCKEQRDVCASIACHNVDFGNLEIEPPKMYNDVLNAPMPEL